MKLTLVIAALALVALCAGCYWFYAKSDETTVDLTAKPTGKVLVVYYSQSVTKNTETAAKWIARELEADIAEIVMETPYTDDYSELLKVSKADMENHVLPPIKPLGVNVADYDVIFVGSPIWYGTFAPPVGTFLAANDFTGKTIAPFCTHGGGGSGRFYADVAASAKGATVKKGLAVRGSNIVERKLHRGTASKESPDVIVNWVNEIFKH